MTQIRDDRGALAGLVNNAASNFIGRTQNLSSRRFDAIANIIHSRAPRMPHCGHRTAWQVR